MNPIKHGCWRIHAVEVNSEPASDNEDYHLLISTADELKILPIGITFKVNQATARSAVLQAQLQLYFADFFVRGEQLTLNLTRPSFSETVSMFAVFLSAASGDLA